MKRYYKAAIFMVLFITVCRVSNTAEIITKDMNGDGKPDAWSYVTNRSVGRQEFDINFDGVVDSVFLYDENGKVKEEILDTNYDGAMDNWRLYENGRLILERIDSNTDGKVDIWIYVERGRIYRIERDETQDGKPDYTIKY